MPRDDLSIDFVRKMPQAEPQDPGLILDDWVNRVQNLPEEIRFIHEEITEKDRQFNECIRVIEDRDAKIQKWIKSNGSREPNPKEDTLRSQIRENYSRADQFQKDKIALAQKLSHIMDKHIRSLDAQIKNLYDRGEPGFTDPDEVPSLLRPSAANPTAPSIRPMNSAGSISVGGPAATAGTAAAAAAAAAAASTNPALARLPQVRSAQNQQQLQQHASSAPATPAASMILNRQQRESSAGPATKRGGRANSGLGAVPATSSGLARHASLGPATSKAGAGAGAGGGVARAGSAGPRASSVKSATSASGRRGTPSGGARKKAPKSSLSRVKKATSRNSPASTADSDLSDAVQRHAWW
ncbi:Chromatin modification-related protein-like protein [Hapsidospora chrysogenum ATCC 11550]|uniref:Chromatin modification-related protein-like protein n=1 Tax=Hapsidospora chrysogenum (strain ATCC 11550 / CBS 779.69 / DSM 880 / IAM 14645 / JCM 23072 / IMI 49137) TaxID=857340 RepID=A0A086SVI3_HAPC1|nr:Chromatin modification-related protein-like protein [Hapsidospora chrysogenum ATCC 11550]